MIKSTFLIVLVSTMACESGKLSTLSSQEQHAEFPVTLVIHGGAGTIKKGDMTPGQEEAYHQTLQIALNTGV